MKLIYDCDDTIGLHGKDVDDGLTLLYLYQQRSVDILGVSLTFGNGTLAEVVQQTDILKSKFDLDVDVYPGKEKDDRSSEKSPAGKFLAQTVAKYPNEVVILATGSMANLREAATIEPNFFKLVKKIVIMGGRFDPMFINEVPIGELNLSIDYSASELVLNSEADLTMISGQYISNTMVSRDELALLHESTDDNYQWLDSAVRDWMDYTEGIWNIPGFVNWDGITAQALLEPDYFEFEDYSITANSTGLMSGYIQKNDSSSRQVKVMTKIKDLARINEIFLNTLNNYWN